MMLTLMSVFNRLVFWFNVCTWSSVVESAESTCGRIGNSAAYQVTKGVVGYGLGFLETVVGGNIVFGGLRKAV